MGISTKDSVRDNLVLMPVHHTLQVTDFLFFSTTESGICADISLDSMYMLSQRNEGSGALGPRERPRSYHEYVSKSQPPTGVSGGPPLVTDVSSRSTST